MSPGRLEAHGLSLPAAPPPTHREERERLPPFPGGTPEDLAARAPSYLDSARARLEALHRAGASGLSVCRLVAEVHDRLARGAFAELSRKLAPGEKIALAALGGYGRRETAPFSDLDLLLLRPSGGERGARKLAEALHTFLWDLKLTVGWSARTPGECARGAEADHTVLASLLDARLLCGAEAPFRLLDRLVRELLSKRADAFIAQKVAELCGRREKHGDSLYLLEPNVKAGEGGLRDLEAALWIARARYRLGGLEELLRASLVPASEAARMGAARDFLMRIRNHLHFARRRKEDRLTYELQEEVARFLGYAPSPEASGVERFMRDYYLCANALRRGADALIARCEEDAPGRGRPARERRLGDFKTLRGRLTFARGADPSARPELALRLFRVAEEEGLEIHSLARELVAGALPALGEARARPEVASELKAALAHPGTRGRAAWEMHEQGVLGAVLPELGRITALHQSDLYHVYTVDVHSLFALRRLYELREGDRLADEPELTREMAAVADPLPLYLGTLLHDAGKGLGGRHAERGRELMARVGERLGLSKRQREIAELLVLHHLTLSQAAQRRDLSDPDFVGALAGQVGDVERLTCLYLLTYADMAAVAPGTWNDWRRRLVGEAFHKVRARLLGTAAPDERATRTAELVARWTAAFGGERARSLAASLPPHYFLSTPPRSANLHARLLSRASRQRLATFVRAEDGASELTICTRDRPGLLAQLAGVLSAWGIDILGARIASTQDGFALDAFDVRGPRGQKLERGRWRKARADLARVLSGETTAEEVLRRRRQSPLWARRLPKVPAKVSIDNRASRSFTVLDVRAEDRPGLLYDIARAIHEAGGEIAIAKIATEAHHAIDSFYVTRGGAPLSSPAGAGALAAAIERAICPPPPVGRST